MFLCLKCYSEKNFVNSNTDKDFIKMDLMTKLISQDAYKMNNKPW